ncbi:GMC oxidoreductase [Hirsutella rhossiliensis]
MYGKDQYDWNFISPPQPKLNNRTIPQARGRMLGGSSLLNFLMVVYPSKASIDAWGALGNGGWNYDALAPYYRKFAKTHPPSQNAREFCRLDGLCIQGISAAETGPLAVTFGEGFGPNNAAWFDAFEELGLNMATDPRTGMAGVGAFQQPATIDPIAKTRTSAVSAYLTPKRIILEPVVSGDNVEFVAKGVEIRSEDGSNRRVGARNEVILAAGALHTPQILELSGIGSRELLEKHGVPVLIDNPNVGEHMQDHPVVAENFEVADSVTSGDMLRDPALIQAVVAQYQANQEGPLSQSIISSAYVPMADSSGVLSTDARRQLLDRHLGAATKCSEAERGVIRAILETDNEAAYQCLLFPMQSNIMDNPTHVGEYLVPVLPENYLTIMTILNYPFSRGSCHIVSPHVEDKPVWDPRYNDEDIDMELLVRGVQFVSKLVATQPLRKIIKEGGKRSSEGESLDAAKDVVRKRQVSVFHVSSSAAMLPREAGGVVDSRLRVYGVKNLRVIDASIFPLEPLGNIQSTVYAVAERAADIIKKDRENAE